MIAKLRENRVLRTYLGGGRIDALIHGRRTPDGYFPEDWLASTVRAFNPGREDIVEGLGASEDGTPVSELMPEGLPILVKLLDAAERLVIQVHPTRAFAREAWHSPVGKTESWYILEADEDACIYIGFREFVTRDGWIRLCESQDVPGMLNCLHRFSVRPGDCVFVPGGVPHAIGGGCLMLETQEPSDLMVIPERKTPRGAALPDRKLHGGIGFDRMYDCFVYDSLTKDAARKHFFRQSRRLDAAYSLLIDGQENGIFSVLRCDTAITCRRAFDESCAVVVITEGEGVLSLQEESVNVRRGDRLLLRLSGETLTTHPAPGEQLSFVMALPAKG